MRSALLSFLASAFVFVGCATNRIDWNARVGQYTYDDAIRELGVPDRSATLTDGTQVAEWLTSHGAAYGSTHGFGWHYQSYDITQFPDQYLRLVFGPDNKLVRSENFAR